MYIPSDIFNTSGWLSTIKNPVIVFNMFINNENEDLSIKEVYDQTDNRKNNP